jgi:Type III restriction enzyme, res subunit
MGFRTKKVDNTNFDTPQEMYKDYKKRAIQGTLDYQSKMIDNYMDEAINKRDVALELPTGSGKTLIGLLIGEFRRRKNKEKVVYLCPNNQLVNQVVEKAYSTYGIKVHGFTGKIIDYPPEARSAYNTAEAIAVTNYSSLFNNNSFFDDADILIFDDAHSSENYIASHWSVDISRFEYPELYRSLVECTKDELGSTNYNRMINDTPMAEDSFWSDKLPNVKFLEKIPELIPVLDAHVSNNKLRYSWTNIKDNLHACNMYISWSSILIRPYIPPTLTHSPFSNAKQRIYMSATLGESGELERITGVKNIYRLPIVSDWDKKSIGRKFFLFPNASFPAKENANILLKINEQVDRTLMLVQDDKSASNVKDFIEKETNTKVFLSKDIEKGTDEFVSSENGIAILANRYDGIDMDGDKSHMLVLGNLQSATHLQEKFLTSKMAASVLFNERIRTRIIQAIGRCTRSDVDYAAVCIFGNDLETALLSPKNIVNYPPELRAELEFGYEQSTGHENLEGLLELLNLFLQQGEEWEDADNNIIGLRDNFIDEDGTSDVIRNFEKLRNSVSYEVDYQYALWRSDFDEAIKRVEQLLPNLDGSALKGYKGYWNYVAGYLAYNIYKDGREKYREVALHYFKQASKSTNAINWFNNLIDSRDLDEKDIREEGLFETIERIETQIIKDGVRNSRKFESKVSEVLKLLQSDDGTEFERGHVILGEMLGYISKNSDGVSDPDPWWIVDERLAIVSEDKIYEDSNKQIPVKHVRQALTHEEWIREKIDTLNRHANIETIFITTSEVIEESAAIYGKNIWYVNRKEFFEWANCALGALRKLRRSFSEQGDMIWRMEAAQILKDDNVTPSDFLDFIRRERLSEISTSQTIKN